MGQPSDGTQPNQSKPTESGPGKENMDQTSDETQPNQSKPTESNSGKENTGQSLEGSQPVPPEGQIIESTQSNENTGQSLEETQPITREEPNSSQEMKPTVTKDRAEEILKLLQGKEEAVVLTGNAGIGKTWLAREVAERAVGTKAFYMSLWLFLKEKPDYNYKSISQSIAFQLSIPFRAPLWEDVDDTDDWKKEEYAESLEQLLPKVIEKLDKEKKEMVDKHLEKQMTFLLLVLDSEGVIKTGDYNRIVKELFLSENVKLKLGGSFTVKVLVTTRNINEGFVPDKESIRVVEIQPLLGNEAVSLFKEKGDEDKVLEHSKCNAFCDAISKRKVLPAQMIMLAEALKRIAKEKDAEALERAFDAALDILKHAKEDDPIPLLHFSYEKLPDDCIIDCFWHSRKFLGEHGAVQYNALIAHWMLEGHLDLAAGVKTAYEKGYEVLMELIDRGMLKMQEDNLIVLEGAILTPHLDDQDHSCRGLFEISKLGLASVLEDSDHKVFERMAPADGMMKTVSVVKKEESVSSLLIDGSRLCREVPEAFFKAKQKLQVLALFYPRFTSLPESISTMENLLVFVLRDCYLLNDIDCIKNLKALKVLEISGSPFLKEVKDDFFQNMSQLRSLNLSALGIQSLPPTFSNLTELRRLIIKNCPFLEALPKLAKLKGLEVIDLSGSSSLKKIQEKSFKSIEKLRFLDFSGTKIEKLPIVQTLPQLRILLVRECDHLYGLRSMKRLPELKVLDVSGATRIKEIYYDCFDGTDNFRILNLSRTEIGFLPDSLGKHLCDLKLKSCPKLVKLLNTAALTELESLDLSDSSGLETFPGSFFQNLTSLQSLNLSNTKIKTLPSLSELHNLRHLLLKDCSLESLPDLKDFTHLVELDLSNCKSSTDQLSLAGLKYLEIINLSGYKALSKVDESFVHMSWLQVLNLSETRISSLPSLCSQPSRLRSLILRNCTELQSPPNFEILTRLEELDLRGTSALKDVKAESLNPLTQLRTLRSSKTAAACIESLSKNMEKLEVLDISGEAVESLPSLDCLGNLRELLLSGCSSLEELPSLNSLEQLEVLDLSGTKVSKLGEKISNLTNLKSLHLPEKVIEEFKKPEELIEEVKKGEYVKILPLELKLDRCCIPKLSDVPDGDTNSKINVHGTEFFKSLKENSEKNGALLERISSIHSESKDEDNYGNSRKHIFSDIYSMIRKLPPEAKDGQSLEIQGFDEFPVDIDVVLEHTKYVFLVENNLLKNLSDIKPSLKNIRGFWLERCTKMESIFMEVDIGKWENLEILWISNLPKLKSLYEEKVQSLSFKNLKQLYVDCCPMLETVFLSGQIPENLETLQITFCEKLKTLVGDKGSANMVVPTSSSPSEKVPATSSVDKGGQITSLTNKEEQAKSSADSKMQAPSAGKEGQPPNTSSADNEGQAKTPSSAEQEVQTMSITNLKCLHISNCPVLETVFLSGQQLTKLEILQIKFCDSLKSLFRQELLNPEVPKLQTSHPSELPNQTSSSTGPKSNKSIPKDAEVPNIHEESPRSEDAPITKVDETEI